MADHGIQIGQRHGIGSELEIQSAQLHPDLGKIGLNDEHAFKRCYGSFKIAHRDGEFGKSEGLVKIAHVFIHLKKRRVVLCFERGFLSGIPRRRHGHKQHHKRSQIAFCLIKKRVAYSVHG